MNISRVNSRAINDRKTTTIKIRSNYEVGDVIEGHNASLTIMDVDAVNDLKSIVNLHNEAGQWWTIVSNSEPENEKLIFAVVHPVRK
jgi:hypothetical protein